MDWFLKLKSHNNTESREDVVLLTIMSPGGFFDEYAEKIKNEVVEKYTAQKLENGWELDSAEFVPSTEFEKTSYFKKNGETDKWDTYFEAVSLVKTPNGYDFDTVSLFQVGTDLYPSLIPQQTRMKHPSIVLEAINEKSPNDEIYTVREISEVEYKKKQEEIGNKWELGKNGNASKPKPKQTDA